MMNTPHHSMKRTTYWECLWFVCITLSLLIAINIQDWAYHAFQMNREVLAWGVIGSSTLIAWGLSSSGLWKYKKRAFQGSFLVSWWKCNWLFGSCFFQAVCLIFLKALIGNRCNFQQQSDDFQFLFHVSSLLLLDSLHNFFRVHADTEW